MATCIQSKLVIQQKQKVQIILHAPIHSQSLLVENEKDILRALKQKEESHRELPQGIQLFSLA